MPLASIFRIRANHEYPMLVCLLVALIGADAVRRSWRWAWLTPIALASALLIKGVFVLVPLIAVALGSCLNPRRARLELAPARRLSSLWPLACGHGPRRPGVRRGLPSRHRGNVLGAVLGSPTGAAHHRDPRRWRLGAVAPLALLPRCACVASRAVEPGPSSPPRGRTAARLTRRGTPLTHAQARGLMFALAAHCSPSADARPASRFAERYIFSANYLIAAAGVVVGAPHVAVAAPRARRRGPACARSRRRVAVARPDRRPAGGRTVSSANQRLRPCALVRDQQNARRRPPRQQVAQLGVEERPTRHLAQSRHGRPKFSVVRSRPRASRIRRADS